MVAVSKDLGQGNQSQRQLDAHHPSPGGITQYVPIDPGPLPLEQYAPAIPVRVIFPTPLPSLWIYILFYRASDRRRCTTTTPPVTDVFLTM